MFALRIGCLSIIHKSHGILEIDTSQVLSYRLLVIYQSVDTIYLGLHVFFSYHLTTSKWPSKTHLILPQLLSKSSIKAIFRLISYDYAIFASQC